MKDPTNNNKQVRRDLLKQNSVWFSPPFGGPKDDPQSDPKGGSASQSIKQISEDLKAFFGEGEKKKVDLPPLNPPFIPIIRTSNVDQAFIDLVIQIGDEKKKTNILLEMGQMVEMVVEQTFSQIIMAMVGALEAAPFLVFFS